MTTPAFAFLKQIVITSSNNAIAFEVGATAYTATIASGTYYATGKGGSDDIGMAIANAIYAETGSEFVQATVGDDGMMEIAAYNGTVDIYWASSSTTFDATLIGESVVTTTYTTTKRDTITQPDGCMYFVEQAQSDTIEDKHRKGSVLISQDGTSYSHLIGDAHATREILTGLESKTNILTNYVAWWESIGTSSFYYYDYSAATATEYVLDESSLQSIGKSRYAPGVALYSLTVRMVAQ